MLVRSGRFFFKYRNVLFPLVFVPVALGTKPRMLFGDARLSAWLQIAGLALIVLGQSLRSLVIGLSHIQRGGRKKQIHAPALLEQGVFAHSRNPLYVGNILILTGIAIVHNGVWMYVALLPFFFFVYASMVAAEESYLRQQFGAQYARYCEHVPRFLPDLTGIRATFAASTFDWRRLVRLEHAPAFASATAVIVILVWAQISERGFDAARAQVRSLAIVWAALFLAYVSVRVLKKRGVFASVRA